MIEIKELADLAKEAAFTPYLLKDEGIGVPLLVVPQHGDDPVAVIDLSAHLANPARRAVSIPVIEVDDFVHYVNTYKEPGYTALFASLGNGTVTAVIDYHKADAGNDPKLRYNEHVCTLKLEPDPDWIAWTKGNGQFVGQDAFADFIDGQAHTIYDPDAASIRDIVLRFQASAITKFERPVYDEASGSVNVAFVRENEEKGSVKLPASIGVALSPYRSSPVQQIEAKLRWRFRDGGVVFGWEIIRPDRIAEAAFRAVLEVVDKSTDIHPVLGP